MVAVPMNIAEMFETVIVRPEQVNIEMQLQAHVHYERVPENICWELKAPLLTLES